ncbi:hypothetical protein [Cesiribacter sp. SM1]|uniref:hypothetical protein n=1 Tax=Cesiribacter sp. SM1 TaxID=2861196 RepID=UPI001CD49485|nr:hypothetical protein [Cesiribacter sp. SM1]
MRIIKSEEISHHLLLSLTSLRAEEFMAVLSEFDKLWQQYHCYHDLKGKKRSLPKHNEHSDISLKGSHDKLLFILIYLHRTAEAAKSYSGISWINVFHEPRKGEPMAETTAAFIGKEPASAQDASSKNGRSTVFESEGTGRVLYPAGWH